MDLIRVKNMYGTISVSYPDVVIACIEHKVSLEAFKQLGSVGGFDNNIKKLFPGG